MKLQEFRQRLEQNPEYLKASEELRLQITLANAVLMGRLNKGWSQTKLAEAVGTKQANISRIEAGLANPTLSLIDKILRALDLDLSVQSPTQESEYALNSTHNTDEIIQVFNWPQQSPCASTSYNIETGIVAKQGK